MMKIMPEEARSLGNFYTDWLTLSRHTILSTSSEGSTLHWKLNTTAKWNV